MKIAIAGGTGAAGRHVVDVARERGHAVVVVSRSTGVDLAGGAEASGGDGVRPSGADDGRASGASGVDDVRASGANGGRASGADSPLVRTLAGVDAVIDVTSVQTRSAATSERFFGTVTRRLLAAEAAAGVGHHLALSIVGSDRAPFGYYAGKALQERLVSAGPVPWTILRATQFHEFAQQILGQVTVGPLNLVPRMVSQPVAAREVGERLVQLAEAGPAGRAADLAGPEVLRMAAMVRAFAAAVGARGPVLELPLPGGFGKALRDGTLLPAPGATLGRQTFAEWLAERPIRSP